MLEMDLQMLLDPLEFLNRGRVYLGYINIVSYESPFSLLSLLQPSPIRCKKTSFDLGGNDRQSSPNDIKVDNMTPKSYALNMKLV